MEQRKDEILALYGETIKNIKDAQSMLMYFNRISEEVFEEEYKKMVIEAIENNAYIDCEYDVSPGVYDAIDYFTLVDKKTKRIIKEYKD
ncbi:MAG TPA: hypothetical protein PL041_07725 [Melioribacteraceae bacterium]|nr:hypothetical protein [Melioribacteraceae bacterium]